MDTIGVASELPGPDAPGVIVLDQAKRILFRNKVAESILGLDCVLTERRNALRCKPTSIELQLRAAVERGKAAYDAPALRPWMTCLPRAEGGPLMVMIVSLRAEGLIDPGALVLIWDMQTSRPRPLHSLQEMFGLTAAEAAIAAATYQGKTLTEIAQTRRCSINTVRTLLSRVFQKCNVRRQAELVRLISEITNIQCFADGVQMGLSMRSAFTASCLGTLRHQAGELLAREEMLLRSAESPVRLMDFAPGQSTPLHLHSHGHEIVCVVRGEMITEFADDGSSFARTGEALYIGDKIVHRGYNASQTETAQLLVIEIKKRDQPFRVNLASM